ncbi:MAG: T9SS type A sorting domain-containing protein [candidate division Zixibacteria bacterium]|nr:T9SS type A sorting domain-containing protein [candidate division Zixibacteria bacterium]
MRQLFLFFVSIIFIASPFTHGYAVDLKSELTASGLDNPVFLTSPNGDNERLFIVEQPGKIMIIQNGGILPEPFLDIEDQVSYGGERGLLGLAFHPDYSQNGLFFVNYTDNSGNTVVSKWSVSGNPNIADPSSEQPILNIDQPFSNHNGGMIAFGINDGYLYIGTGDGGSGGDPYGNSQSDSTLLGKMLRIDVDNGNPYSIPPDNPYIGSEYPLDEIWAKGLRNPWRFCFDPANGDMYIADVGQNVWEEIHYQPGTSNGGENYGWNIMEGAHCYEPPQNCDTVGLEFPIHEYSHGGSPFRCSITGGYIYRGDDIPELQGTYFFADYCSGQIWTFEYDGREIRELTDRTNELQPETGEQIGTIVSFGRDAGGEIYIIDHDGEVFKILPFEPTGFAGDGNSSLPVKASIITNYPNPFNNSTTIRYYLPEKQDVEINIYNIKGELVENIYRGSIGPGEHSIRWSDENLASGIYFLYLNTKGDRAYSKMVIIR